MAKDDDGLCSYRRRIWEIYEPRERRILLDHLEGIYEMSGGNEAKGNPEDVQEAIRFLDNALERMETRRQAEKILRRHRPSLEN